MRYSEARFGRLFVMRLHDGDHLPEVLESFAARKRISSGLCFLLGGVRDKGRVVVGPSNNDAVPPNPMIKVLTGVHEVCGVGTIFSDEKGNPRLHMHASFGRGDHVTTGCIRMGVDVWQIAEVVVIEMRDVAALRKRDDKTKFELLEIEQSRTDSSK